MEFYNVKLKKKVSVDEKDFEVVTMKNGRPAAKAEVTIDGETHKMFKILSKADAEKYAQTFFSNSLISNYAYGLSTCYRKPVG